MSQSVDRVALRRGIREYVETNGRVYESELVNEVVSDQNVPGGAVEDELDDLEQHGFVYLVETETGTRVKLP